MSKLFRIGTLNTAHVAYACNCGRLECVTSRGNEVQVKFKWGREPEYYTVPCAARVLSVLGSDIEWVWMDEATQRRALVGRPVTLPQFAEVA